MSRLQGLQGPFFDALALYRAGKLDAAERACRKIVQDNPTQVDAMHLRALIAMRRGDADAAIVIMNRAIEIKPHDAKLLANLGSILMSAGRQDAALARFDAALAVDRNLTKAHAGRAIILYNKGAFQAAEPHFRAALKANPKNIQMLQGLLQVLGAQSRVDEAAQVAREIIVIKPDDAHAHSGLGAALDRLGDFDGAVDAHRRAKELSGNAADVWYGLVLTLTAFGHLEEAEAECRALLAAHGGFVKAHTRLANLTKTSSEAEIAELKRLSVLETVDLNDRIRILIVLGSIFEKREDFTQAFSYYREGNALARQQSPYAVSEDEAYFAEVKQAFPRPVLEKHANSGCDDPTPIFIVGMPRSGTTLVEQILSSHPDVVGAGELTALFDQFNKLSATSLVDTIANTTPKELRRLGEDYIAEARTFSKSAPYIIDKMPSNFLNLGLISLILPKAKVIHCRRDPLDTCLSIFKTRFTQGSLRFGNDMSDLGAYYRLYEDLMRFWNENLPVKPIEVVYENVVADSRAETARLLEALGLDWSEDCTRFFENRRSVHTASITQVRQPIYATSIGLAERFGADLDPLRQALAGKD